MKTLDSLIRMGVQLVAAAAIVSCGGGDGGSVENHPPTISNLSYTPASALQTPDGTAVINGTVDFTDAGADIVALRMTSSAGADLTVPIAGASGVQSGTGTGSLVVSVDEVGKYTFDVWLLDSLGSASNHLSGTFEVLVNDTAQHWRQLDIPSLQGRILLGLTFSGEQYLAVGDEGVVVTSPDATNWTLRQTGSTANLKGVAWSGTRFVAVGGDPTSGGDAVVLSSPDGANWTVRSWVRGSCQGCTRPARLEDVIWAGSQFVAVGQEEIVGAAAGRHALIVTSPDGVNWTQRAEATLPLGTSSVGGTWSSMGGVVWTGSKLVAVGFGPTDSPASWTSSDGISWAHNPMTIQARDQALSDVTWGGGRLVAVGMGGPAYSSSDGVTWQQSTTTLTAVNAVASGPSRYVAVHPVFREISVDALQWSMQSASGVACGNDVIWDGLRYVAIGSGVCISP